jgi:hypothetical protein
VRFEEGKEREEIDLLEFEGSFGVFEFPVPEIVAGVGQDWGDVEDVGDGYPGHSQGLRDVLQIGGEGKRMAINWTFCRLIVDCLTTVNE